MNNSYGLSQALDAAIMALREAGQKSRATPLEKYYVSEGAKIDAGIINSFVGAIQNGRCSILLDGVVYWGTMPDARELSPIDPSLPK